MNLLQVLSVQQTLTIPRTNGVSRLRITASDTHANLALIHRPDGKRTWFKTRRTTRSNMHRRTAVSVL